MLLAGREVSEELLQELQQRDAEHDSLESGLAIDLVVAWRIHHLSKLGRETPDVPCTVYFADHEWQALVAAVHRDATAVPAAPPSLREAMRRVASLGGFLGRKADGEPGTQTLWLGAATARRHRPGLVPALRRSGPAAAGPRTPSGPHGLQQSRIRVTISSARPATTRGESPSLVSFGEPRGPAPPSIHP